MKKFKVLLSVLLVISMLASFAIAEAVVEAHYADGVLTWTASGFTGMAQVLLDGEDIGANRYEPDFGGQYTSVLEPGDHVLTLRDRSGVSASDTFTVEGTVTPAPATDTPAPATDTPAPATDTPAPATDTPAPATATPAPITWEDKFDDIDEYKNHKDHDVVAVEGATDNVAATCVADGKTRMACNDCHVRFWQIVPATGVHTNTTIVTPATEKIAGSKVTKCTVCGEVASTEIILPTAIVENKVDETVWKKYDLTKTVATPSCAPHVEGWEDPTRAVKATCIKEGIRFFLCVDCGQEYSMVVPKGNHQDMTPAKTEIKEGDEPTCTKAGVLTHIGCAICGKDVVWTTEIAMIPHTYGDVVKVPADCTNDEKSTKTCTVCNHVEETVATGTKLGHAWDRDPDWNEAHEHAVKAPTCTEQGMTGDAQVCDFCGAVKPESWKDYSYIDKLDHLKEIKRAIAVNYTKDVEDDKVAYVTFTKPDGTVTTIVEAGKTTIKGYDGYCDVEIDFTPNTCTEAGKLTAKCADCKVEYTYDKEIPAHGHKWVVIRPDQEGNKVVDCTKPNSILFECIYCTEKMNQAFEPAKDHTWIEDEKGNILNEIVGYKQQKFSDAKLESYTKDEIATCYDYTVTYKCAVDFCTVTKDVVIPGTGKHVAKEYIIQEPATCTEPGRNIYNCDKCGYYQVEYTDPLGHNLVPGKVTKEATCTEEGVREMKCSRTDCKYTESVAIPPLGHHWVITVTKPDCQKGIVGKTIAKCSICGIEEVRATDDGHQKTTILAHKDATCTEDGSETYVCGLCHQLVKTTTKALGHTYEAEDYKHACITEGKNKCVPATCKTGAAHGTIHKDVCGRCGEIKTWEDDDKPENHTMFKEDGSLNRFVIKTLPTCEKAGEAVYVCALCGDTVENVVLAPITHNMQVTFNEKTGAYELTCTKLANNAAGKVNLKNLLRGSKYDEKVADAVVDQMSDTKGEFFAGVGCGYVETIKVVKTEYTITKISDTRGKIELVEGAQPAKDQPYVRITWRFTAKNGDTVSFTTCRDVRDDDTFKLTGLSVPDGYTCNFIYVEVVTDPDADELYAGDYTTYGSKAL